MKMLKLYVVSMMFLFAQSALANGVHGILRVVKGDVQIKSATGAMSKAKIGGKVFPKDVVITGKDSRAKIVMVDNNEINVSPESQIEFKNYEFDPNAGKKDVLLNVIYGKVRSKVEQKYDGKTSHFQIKTPSAVAGVRGTDFITGYDRASRSSTVVTFHGRVEFGTPGPGNSIMNPVSVTPGTMASNTAGSQPTAPAPVPQKDLAQMDKESAADVPASGSGQDSRQPATNGGDKTEKKEDGPKTEGAKTEGPKAEGETKGQGPSRAPNSAGGGTMMLEPKDTAPKQDIVKSPIAGPQPPPMVPPPTMIQPPRVPTCDTCNQVITGGGKGKLIINVNQ